MISQTDDPTDRLRFFERCRMRSIVPGVPDDLVGGPIEDVLAATQPA
jgi:hypothetical protein